MTRHDTGVIRWDPIRKAGQCPVCLRWFPVFYGVPGRERCIDCWIVNPGYHRPDSDPYIVRWADAVAADAPA